MAGWSIWPVIDGVHLATRDRSLDARELDALTPVGLVYAGSRGDLLELIAKQNKLRDDLAAGGQGG